MNRCNPERARRRLLRAALALAGGAALARPAQAAAPRIERFGAGTWKLLLAELPRPALVVFTATWCPNCPEVLRQLAEVRRANRLAAPLVAVVIDGDGHERLHEDPHYRPADRLLVFDGDEAALRYSVQPQWRGVTPFVALLPRAGAPTFVAGAPKPAQIEAWLRG